MQKKTHESDERDPYMYTITIDQAIKDKSCFFIDLRSPSEFQQGTIYGAVNLPILDDEERKMIGTIYKQKSTAVAKIIGIEKVSPKIGDVLKRIEAYTCLYENVILFCSRGGYRSGPLVRLCNQMKIPVYQLKGGYKSYRKYTLAYFDSIERYHQFIVLHGYTGVGKTIILEKLETYGMPCINLEKLAQNSGSVFGFIGQSKEKITQKQFESMLLNRLIKSNASHLFIESESQRLGSVSIPKSIHQHMVNGTHVLINASMEKRVTNLVNEYADKMNQRMEELKKALMDLQQQLGRNKIIEYTNDLDHGRFDRIVLELTKNYYDPLYKHSIQKYSYELNITYDTIEEPLEQLRQFYKMKEGTQNYDETNLL